MVINNHKRIDNLEEQLNSEQARVRFLEDFSDQLGEKVGKLEKAMITVKREVTGQKKSLLTILNVIKIISNHQMETQRKNSKTFEMMKFGLMKVFQNGILFVLIQIIMKMSWLNSLIDSLTELLRIGNVLSKKSMERSRFVIKLSLSVSLFFLLKERIQELMLKLKMIIKCLI